MTSSEHEGIIEALEVGQKITMDRIMLGQLVKVMPLQKSYRHACQVVNEFLDKRIDEAFRHEQKNEKSAINEPLVIVNELVKETGDRAQIRDTLITIYVGGTHTTFIVVSNALFELARHPECLSKLQKELSEIGSHKPDLPTLQKMSYLKGVINEGTRMPSTESDQYPNPKWHG
jgi:cytochrome P450